MDATKKDVVELLTLREAEAMTKRKVSTWRKDIRLRRVPYVRLGRQIRLTRAFVEKLIRDGMRESITLEESAR
ncbi:hypothetical protein [Nitrospira sp. BLG_2]|uniref:hypothetical protein n=1 Tax=Nitrospira sp. BLG_2 TaxID=3397507 RepID=UPI003B9A291F